MKIWILWEIEMLEMWILWEKVNLDESDTISVEFSNSLKYGIPWNIIP